MEATSLGLISLNDNSIPSTNTKGLELFKVPTPRMRIVAISLLGLPDNCKVCTPALIPDNAIERLVRGRESNSFSTLIVETAPVKFIFFCVP